MTDTAHDFTHAKHVVTFIGSDPRIRESGEWQEKTRLSKTGDKLFPKSCTCPPGSP
ncbi:MAG: transposase [Gammaproteobacteria bacterium]